MIVITVILSATAIFGLDRYGKNSRISGRAGTIGDKGIVKRIVNEPAEAYRIWREAGYRGRMVMYVSGNWESFDPGELIPARMFRAYPLQLYNTARLLEEEHLTNVTFLYVAACNGICRGIFSIVPGQEVERMRGVAIKAKDHRVDGSSVFLTREGYPRWYTTGANLGVLDEPVLLYVGASYFRSAKPEELQRQLLAAGVKTDCIVLCREKGKTGVSPEDAVKLDRFAALIGMPATPSADDAKSNLHHRDAQGS
jgi:hypothetical protein